MAKTKTKTKLADLAEKAGKYMNETGYPVRPKRGLMDPAIEVFKDAVRFPVAVERRFGEDGMVSYRARCPQCGREWTQTEAAVTDHACTDHYVVVTEGVDTVLSDRIPGLRAVVTALELHPEDGYGVFALARSDARCRWSFADGKAHFDAGTVFVFSADYGLRPVDRGERGHVLKMDTTGAASLLRAELRSATVAGEPLGPFLKACGVTEDEPEGADALAAMRRHSEKLISDRSAAKKKPSAARAREDAVGTREWDDSRVEALIKARDVGERDALTSTEKTGLGEPTGRVFVRCPRCGKVSYIDDSRVFERRNGNGFGVEPHMPCPGCGADMTLPSNWRTSMSWHRERTEYFTVYNEADGFFVRRDFSYKEKLDQSGVFREEIKERLRVLFGEKAVAAYEPRGLAPWVRTTSYGRGQTAELLQDPGEIRSLFERTDIRRSGLLAYMGLMELPDRERRVEGWSKSEVRYIRAWQKFPFLETLLMAGLTTMVYNFVERDDDPAWVADRNATTPREILGVSKQAFRIIREANVPFGKVGVIRGLCEGDSSFTIDDWRFLDGRSPEELLDIRESFGIPIRKSVEYLGHCYDYQCIEWREALIEWRDYLTMAVKMKYDLSDRTRMFPRSLKLEHDKATFAYRAVEEELRRDSFAEQAKLNRKYEYSYGDFLVRVPETPEEVVAEGTAQKHCVASYVGQIADAQTCVAFIRKKDEPDTPYFTVEIRNGGVQQVRGFCNRPPRDTKLLEFLGRFANAKHLRLAYH